MIELTITELAYRLNVLNDDFKKIHEDWDETREAFLGQT